MLRKQHFIDNYNAEKEGHHKFIWYNRKVGINPISINLKMKSLKSYKLII